MSLIQHARTSFNILTALESVDKLNEGQTPKEVEVSAGGKKFNAKLRIDTPGEADYYRHGGIMQYVLRSLLSK